MTTTNTATPPRINVQSEWSRLTENGSGPCTWQIFTDLPLAAVMMPGFLHDQSRHGAQRLDRVEIIADRLSESPTFARAVVTEARVGAAVVLALAPDSTFSIELPNLTAFEILGVGPRATADEVRTAHRALSKRRHPDAGGTKEAMTRLNRARDEALQLVAAMQAAGA